MNHQKSSKFKDCYARLPNNIKSHADRCFQLLRENPRHPSLHFKRIGRYWSARVGLKYRTLGLGFPEKNGILWFWIGTHSEYDKLLH